MAVTKNSTADNIKRVLDRIREAEKRYGREVGDVTLVAITKTRSSDVVAEAVRAGLFDIGENRVQEAEQKFSEVDIDFKRHLVGHLQTNKVKKALEIFDVIHSIDSLKLASKIASLGGNEKELLLEVNSSEEESKFGVAPDAAIEMLEEITETTGLTINGLMTVGPMSDDENVIRSAFKKLKSLFDRAASSNIRGVNMNYLSMGMTNDFEIAIEEGSNMVRIGRALFGER
ncbi:MAG: YggS family pyridoxal phosphate-dependent enzyme [Candidatus Marinimicrobia bacterium]|nr:YggS family pyridoxal phosphate-dependent enzyme [Candidatus Neomarinimicrobiota bacterium]